MVRLLKDSFRELKTNVEIILVTILDTMTNLAFSKKNTRKHLRHLRVQFSGRGGRIRIYGQPANHLKTWNIKDTW